MLSARFPKEIAAAIRLWRKKNPHYSRTDFIHDAMVEKLEREGFRLADDIARREPKPEKEIEGVDYSKIKHVDDTSPSPAVWPPGRALSPSMMNEPAGPISSGLVPPGAEAALSNAGKVVEDRRANGSPDAQMSTPSAGAPCQSSAQPGEAGRAPKSSP